MTLYLSGPSSWLEKPEMERKDFAKTRLMQPGEEQGLSFELDARFLASFWNGRNAWIADSGASSDPVN